MKVVYISYDGMTDPLGQSQVIPYLSGLSKRGHKITLISCEKKNRFEKQGKFIHELLNSNGIVWYPIPYSTLPSILSKQLNLLRIKQKAYELCKTHNYDAVHCRSYMAALIGLQLKHKYNTKFIFDMRGFWADERVDGKLWDTRNGIQKQLFLYFKKKENEFLNNADYTISLTQNAKNEILSWKLFQNHSIPIEVIPCCVDLKLFSKENINEVQQNELRKKNNIHSTDFVLSYLGSIGTWYMLDEMLDFFKLLTEKKTAAKFLFITQDDRELIISKAKEKGIPEEKIVIHSASRNEVPLYLSLSHVALYFIKPSYSKKASSPTKTGEILSLGIPIITNSGIGDSDQLIENSGSGMLVHHFSTNEYSHIIDQIDVLLALDKTKIIATARNYFSLEKGIELYDSVYKKVATNK